MDPPPRPLSPSLPTIHSPLPPTLLPSDPILLSRYLRSHQLSSLRHLYAYKTSLLAQESALAYESSRGRGGRARRRRGSSPLIEKEDLGVQDERDLFEVRKKFKWDPAVELAQKEEEEEILGTAEMLVTLRKGERERKKEEMVDQSHTFDLVYDLTPDLGSDSYYHGPHPEPPARVVRTILKATKQKPFVDPDDLSTVQLEGMTRGLWEREGRAISVGFGTGKEGGDSLTREEQRVQKVMEEDELADWEEMVVAGFSSTCNERIGRGRLGRPLEGKGIREMANHLQGAQTQSQTTTTSSAPPTAAGPHMASQLTAQGYAMGQVQGQAQLAANQYGEREREREYLQQQNAMGGGAHWR